MEELQSDGSKLPENANTELEVSFSHSVVEELPSVRLWTAALPLITYLQSRALWTNDLMTQMCMPRLKQAIMRIIKTLLFEICSS